MRLTCQSAWLTGMKPWVVALAWCKTECVGVACNLVNSKMKVE